MSSKKLKTIKQMADKGDLFNFENDGQKMSTWPIEALEQTEIFGETPSGLEVNSRIFFNLPNTSTYVFNSDRRIFVECHMEKSTKTGTTWSEFEPAQSGDMVDVTFYPGFIRKKFDLEFYLRDVKVEINQSFDQVNSQIESFLFGHMQTNQRNILFGGNSHDSSRLNMLDRNAYVLEDDNYRDYILPAFGGSHAIYSFTPIMSLPWGNKLEASQSVTKNIILPAIEDTVSGYSIRLKIRDDKSVFFHNESCKDKFRYRLKINHVKFVLDRIRFHASGYSIPRTSLLRSNSNQIASFVFNSYLAKVNDNDIFLLKTFYGIRAPSRLLVFKLADEYFSGISDEYSFKNLDAFLPTNVSSAQVLSNDLKIYDSDINNLNQTSFFSRYNGIVKDRRDFLGFKLDETLTVEFMTSQRYLFPHLNFSFELDHSSNLTQSVTPVLASNMKQLDQPQDLTIKLNFSNFNITTKGVFVFVFLYEKNNFVMDQSGYIKNPLLMSA